jgi:hypothetical protein
MKRTLKFVAIAAVIAAVGAMGQAMANCQNEGPYPVRQCSTAAGVPTWFVPAPGDAGAISATWWLLGSGNRPVIDPTVGVSTTPVDGDGFIDTPNPGVFIGNDAGALTIGPATGEVTGGLDLVDAAAGTGFPGAAGGLCFSASANWALPFIDGCSDQNRTYASLGAALNGSDNYIDPYFTAATGGVGIETSYGLVDSPMATLLTEANNKYFAVAFFSSTFRNGDPNDIFDKGYDMGAIMNGDPNPAAPGANNLIPWQPIPQPSISAVVDPNGNRVLSFGWQHIRVVRDNSSRVNTGAMVDAVSTRWVLGKDRNNQNLTGVGILEQPELMSYQVERKPIVGLDCDANAPWQAIGPPIVPALSTQPGTAQGTSVTVPPDTCVRLQTRFGRIPSENFDPNVTLTARNQNRFRAQAGNLGDLGYNVNSDPKKIGGPLVGDKAVLKSATFTQKSLVVVFESLGELAVQNFQVMAKDRRGTTSVVATVECAQCSSGIGSDYRVEIPGPSVRDTKSVFVVVQPSGTRSNEIQITPATQPETPSRGRTSR